MTNKNESLPLGGRRRGQHLIYSTIVAALGGLLFGFDTAVISGTTEWLQKVFQLSSFYLGLTVASALFGTIIGAITIGKPADVFGRKKTLYVIALLYLISALGSALAFAQALGEGVYIVMNGRYFTWDRVRKNRKTGFFEEI